MIDAYCELRAAEARGSKGARRPAVPARDHHVSRGAIRTAIADRLPEHIAAEEGAPAPDLPVTPKRVPVRRGQDYTPRLTRRSRRTPPTPRPLPAPRRQPGRPPGDPGPAKGPQHV
ncbi:hypothetical protein [Streptomyces griseorubiginosus]|uniref:hypothetical protein n=1 Tax=Streptomyces griseorubiginosus TaxID=67304 RepID=UPI000A4BBED6